MSAPTTRPGRGAGDNSAGARAQAAAARVWTQFRGFTAGQQAVTVAAVGALLVGGYLLLAWRPAPTYAPLYSNLAAADASAMVDKLTSAGTPYKLAAGGTEIMVPQDAVSSSRLAMSAAGLPNSGQSGYSLLDKEGVTTSEFKQQVDYQRAVEGELDRTIQGIDGVNAASVHLAVPQQDVFNDDTVKPTASVLLATRPGATLTTGQVQSVVNLVSSSVPGMTAGGVTVSDSAGEVLKAPGQGVSAAGDSSQQAQATQAYDTSVTNGVQNMIDKAIGAGHAVVTVNSTLDFDQVSTTTKNYVHDRNDPPVSKTTSKETYKGAKGAAAGTLGSTGTTGTDGTSSPTDVASTSTSGNGSYSKTSSTVNNSLGTKSSTVQNAPGQLKKLSIAVLLDKSVKGLDVPALTRAVRAGVGFDAARGDTLSVQAMPFDQSQAKADLATGVAATRAAQAKASQQHLIGLVKQGALGLLIAGLALTAWLRSRKAKKRPAEPDDDVFGLDEPELVPAAGPPVESYPPLRPVADFEAAAARRRRLVASADENPQEVARVLSSWLNAKEG